MSSKEPKNPIRCPFCQNIMGKQGLTTHLLAQHPVEYKGWDYTTYERNNKVAKKDIDHPLRQEWRRKNGLSEDSYPEWYKG